MEKLQRKKSVKKAVYFAIYNKYRFEHYGFCLALIGIFYIEFLPCLHLHSIWDYSVCMKINALISQLLLAYIASYIFLCLNVLKKEQKKYDDYYPHIIKLLANLFGIFDSRKERLKNLYKGINKENFLYMMQFQFMPLLNTLKIEKKYIENYMEPKLTVTTLLQTNLREVII